MKLKSFGRVALNRTLLLSAIMGGILTFPCEIQAVENGCVTRKAVEIDGQRRLALVVGVGTYVAEGARPLPGATEDGKRIFNLLTEPRKGYRFPIENVCLLSDKDATLASFKGQFSNLVGKLKDRNPQQHNDVVVIYFAGHGSQLPTNNLGDEPDGMDETLVLHDGEEDGSGMLVDDEFGEMLRKLYQRTHNVAVILDSCTSASATRGDETGIAVRFYDRPVRSRTSIEPPMRDAARGVPVVDVAKSELPEMVVLAAAADGTSAYETAQGGFFTNALVTTLAPTRVEPMTYAEVEAKIREALRAKSLQIPFVEGNREKVVFGIRTRTRPLSLEVKAIRAGPNQEQHLTLEGTPLPGVGVGAELRIFSGRALKIDARNPSDAIATVVVERSSGVSSQAVVSAEGPKKGKIQLGDLAVLVRPSDTYVQLRVRIRTRGGDGVVPELRATKIRKAIEGNSNIASLITLVQAEREPADFELARAADNRLYLSDELGRVRAQYNQGAEEAETIGENLRAHAVQRALLQLEGEGGKSLKDSQSLKVTIVPIGSDEIPQCKKWETPPEQAVIRTGLVPIPLCSCYKVLVELIVDPVKPLLVGGLVLSANGSISTLSTQKIELKKKGEKHVFVGSLGGAFQTEPPIDGIDRILVVGTDPTQPIPWEAFETSAGLKGVRGTSVLFRALSNYVTPGARAKPVAGNAEDLPWTKSVAAIQVRANEIFHEARGDADPVDPREFTLPQFDIGPYLPDDKNSVLYRLLDEVKKITDKARENGLSGVNYKQHDWKRATETENLKLGIDCSRALWYVFNKAGLQYNHNSKRKVNLTANDTKDYLSTGEMLGPQSLMNDEFEICTGNSVQIGDILVYRDKENKSGHTVMVIDSSVEKLYAWGSHGYDSGAKQLGREPLTGVEFQKIKSSRDWRRWDRVDMQLKGCWRYRKLDQELRTFVGRPGLKATADICGPS